MKQYNFDDVEGMQELVSEEFGTWSEEVTISQDMINLFAELTGDDYWLHTDPKKCADYSPFKTTIAHGFLTLVLIPKMRTEQNYEVTGFKNMLNVGSDKLRFTGIVPAGSKIHTRSRIKSVVGSAKGTTMTMKQQIHVVGEERPALVYEMMFMYM
ncbi:protein dehydratase [Endozoicomonas sp. OPT23]|uniref:MaoC family dehydratase n=1 Tax=Endozoicomonas sp. OPT23 TaxID=2072845 RepID=UPI00129A157F|nr:MaoC family dehydratase [Endozoicomonas sp. OPT23]MRI33847.1 protein dehydratase [Endozoicomonas sp. OPT23]